MKKGVFQAELFPSWAWRMDSRAAELLAALGVGAIPTAGVVRWTAGWRGARGLGKHGQDTAHSAQPC